MPDKKCVYIDSVVKSDWEWDGHDEKIVDRQYIRASFNRNDILEPSQTDESCIEKICEGDSMIEFEPDNLC